MRTLTTGRHVRNGWRCPDISKLARLSYKPRVPLREGLPPTLDWYWQHVELAPKA
jgi:nucleoside-diphosphate-sugar epimerase